MAGHKAQQSNQSAVNEWAIEIERAQCVSAGRKKDEAIQKKNIVELFTRIPSFISLPFSQRFVFRSGDLLPNQNLF